MALLASHGDCLCPQGHSRRQVRGGINNGRAGEISFTIRKFKVFRKAYRRKPLGTKLTHPPVGLAPVSGLQIRFIESIPIKLISNAQPLAGCEMVTLGTNGGFTPVSGLQVWILKSKPNKHK
ncbi:hypothetical protein BJI48_08440 [Helicobacter sp. 11S02596-1]|nr:hypothetical protein BJI48_08440 [Helicobacter sp. 11S02596-1]